MRRICNVLLAGRAVVAAAAVIRVREELLCARFNGPDFVLAMAPVKSRYSSDGDLRSWCLYGRKDAYGDATFMISSVTKLTLYAVLLAAHKDEIEKRDAFKGLSLRAAVWCSHHRNLAILSTTNHQSRYKSFALQERFALKVRARTNVEIYEIKLKYTTP